VAVSEMTRSGGTATTIAQARLHGWKIMQTACGLQARHHIWEVILADTTAELLEAIGQAEANWKPPQKYVPSGPVTPQKKPKPLKGWDRYGPGRIEIIETSE
jgi:hypothetical protein